MELGIPATETADLAPEAPPAARPRLGQQLLRASYGFTGSLRFIAALGLTWRLAYLLVERDTATSNDGFSYSVIGSYVARGEGFRNPLLDSPTALHPPAWSSVLAVSSALGLDTIGAHQVVAALVGTVTVVLVGLLGRTLAGERAGLIAAGIAAIHPELWLWERELASEVLLLPLSVLATLLGYRYLRAPGLRRAAELGLVIGLAALTRTEQALLLVTLLLPVVALGRGLPRRRRLVAGIVAVACSAAVLVPWLTYNQGRFREPVLMTTGAGVTLRYAYNPATFDGPYLGYGDPTTWTEYEQGDESQVDAPYRREATQFALDNLDRLPAVVAAREGRTWGLYRPSQQITFDQEWGNSARWVYRWGLWVYWASIPLAVLGAVVLRRRGVSLIPLASTLVGVALYVALTYGQTRYRATADLVLVVLAAVALDHLLRRRRPRRSRASERPRRLATLLEPTMVEPTVVEPVDAEPTVEPPALVHAST